MPRPCWHGVEQTPRWSSTGTAPASPSARLFLPETGGSMFRVAARHLSAEAGGVQSGLSHDWCAAAFAAARALRRSLEQRRRSPDRPRRRPAREPRLPAAAASGPGPLRQLLGRVHVSLADGGDLLAV